MPHFIIHCSADVLENVDEYPINQAVFACVAQTGLFNAKDIKVRFLPFTDAVFGGERNPFIHVFSLIMEGRTTEQKADLSKRVVACLTEYFPHIEMIAMNVDEFDKNTYYKCNT